MHWTDAIFLQPFQEHHGRERKGKNVYPTTDIEISYCIRKRPKGTGKKGKGDSADIKKIKKLRVTLAVIFHHPHEGVVVKHKIAGQNR